jgi:hypothetical protein
VPVFSQKFISYPFPLEGKQVSVLFVHVSTEELIQGACLDLQTPSPLSVVEWLRFPIILIAAFAILIEHRGVVVFPQHVTRIPGDPGIKLGHTPPRNQFLNLLTLRIVGEEGLAICAGVSVPVTIDTADATVVELDANAGAGCHDGIV